MTLDALPDDLKPYEDRLYRVVHGGLALFHQRFSLQRAGMSVRSERSNIHDCMVETAQKIFEPNECQRRGNLFTLALGPYRLKLKKFNDNLVTSSYPTQAVFTFLAQVKNAVRSLFEHDVENLHVGYVPDSQELSVTDYSIWVVKPKMDGKPEWEYLLRPAAASGAKVPDLPATNPNLPPKGRVKAKPSKFRKGDQGKGE
jgi:hypothetical protein